MLSGLLILIHQASGQSENNIYLENVVVTSSRIPIDMKETGRNISVITSDEINELPANSVDELLRYIPGVEAQSRGGFGVQSDIIIRGSTFQQVLILIDGMRLNDPLTGHFNGYVPITPAEIDRIEVLRGPAASLFGADAVGGVIHIITKTFSRQKSAENDAVAGISIGEHKLISAQMGTYMRLGKLDFSLGGITNNSDGHKLSSGANGDFNIHTMSGSAGYRFSDRWQLMGRSGYDFRDFNAQYFYTRSTFDQSRETTSNLWGQLKLRNDKERSATDFDLAFKRTEDKFVFNPDFPSTNEHTTRFLNFQINRFHDLLPTVALAYGIQADHRYIQSTDRGEHDDTHLGVYGVLNYGIDNFNITGSLRADYDQNYDLEFIPQLNSSLAIRKLIIRGAVGRSIRAGDYTERYISTNIPGPLTPGRNLGNPDLKAESAWSFEGGLDYFPTNGLKLIGTAFIRNSSSLIDFVITNENDISNNETLEADQDYFWARNLEDVTTKGFEAESWFLRKVSENVSLNLVFGYTYLHTSNSEGEVSKYISNHAGHLVTHRALLNIGRWDLSLSALHKARDKDQAEAINSELESNYMVWNTRIAYRHKSNLGFNWEIRNIFDEQYSDILGARMPDRWIIGGVTWRMNRK